MRRFALLLCLAALAAAFGIDARGDDGNEGASCKHGWHMCWCKREGRARRLCESDDLQKKCSVCWGEIAQYQCLRGTKAEVLDKAYAQAKKEDKLLLYIANTGG